MSNTPNETQMEAIRAALYEGRKIEAIKLYREATQSSLKDSKEAMDKLEASLRSHSPQLFKHAARSGCAGMLVLACSFVIFLVVCVLST